jgi:NADPH:quinone reductase-like Zn-dependent oxidoreductase
MMIRLGMRRGIEMINIVRRDEQVNDLQAMGATHVLYSNAPDFEARLRELCHSLDARIAFEAVAGVLSGQVLQAMPDGSRMIVYGALSFEHCSIWPGELIFRDKYVDGFWLVNWVSRVNMETLGAAVTEVMSRLDSDYKSTIRVRYSLAETPQALADHSSHMTGGLVMLKP